MVKKCPKCNSISTHLLAQRGWMMIDAGGGGGAKHYYCRNCANVFK